MEYKMNIDVEARNIHMGFENIKTQCCVHLVHTSRLNFSDWPVYQMESACHGMAMLLKWSAMEYRREGGGSWNTAGVGWNTDGDGGGSRIEYGRTQAGHYYAVI